jgi:hypothetical protein
LGFGDGPQLFTDGVDPVDPGLDTDARW